MSAYKEVGQSLILLMICSVIAVRIAGDAEPVSKTAMTLPSLYVSCKIPLCTVALAGPECITGLELSSVAVFVGSHSFLYSIQGILLIEIICREIQ